MRKDETRNRVRITAQLINVEDGYHLWSEIYDRDLNDIFAIQEEIARKVATALKVTLLGEDEERIAAQAVTDLSAYDLYLRGLQQVNTHSFASLNEALVIFGQAIEQDSNYLPAKLKLAQTWLDLALIGAVTNGARVSVNKASNAALGVSSSISFAKPTRGLRCFMIVFQLKAWNKRSIPPSVAMLPAQCVWH